MSNTSRAIFRELWQGGAPLSSANRIPVDTEHRTNYDEIRGLFVAMLNELRILNIHMAKVTDELVTPEDLPDA